MELKGEKTDPNTGPGKKWWSNLRYLPVRHHPHYLIIAIFCPASFTNTRSIVLLEQLIKIYNESNTHKSPPLLNGPSSVFPSKFCETALSSKKSRLQQCLVLWPRPEEKLFSFLTYFWPLFKEYKKNGIFKPCIEGHS